VDLLVFTLLGAFAIGLAHTLEPCEDKAVVSLYALWGSERWREGLILVTLYGLGMTLIDTLLGFLSSFMGEFILKKYDWLFKATAGAITMMFGFFMIKGFSIVHVLHHHDGAGKSFPMYKNEKMLSSLFFGLVRGLPPCPIEIAILSWAAGIGNVLLGTLAVFIFGLGTTIGLIPLGFFMGCFAGAIKRTKASAYVPKITGLIVIIIGFILILSTFGFTTFIFPH